MIKCGDNSTKTLLKSCLNIRSTLCDDLCAREQLLIEIMILWTTEVNLTLCVYVECLWSFEKIGIGFVFAQLGGAGKLLMTLSLSDGLWCNYHIQTKVSLNFIFDDNGNVAQRMGYSTTFITLQFWSREMLSHKNLLWQN